MKEEEDKAKLQLLKYYIGAGGRDIYNTLKHSVWVTFVNHYESL